MERVGQAVVGDLPAVGQARDDLGGVVLVLDEVLVDLDRDLGGLAVVVDGRVEAAGLGALAVGDGVGARDGGGTGGGAGGLGGALAAAAREDGGAGGQAAALQEAAARECR